MRALTWSCRCRSRATASSCVMMACDCPCSLAERNFAFADDNSRSSCSSLSMVTTDGESNISFMSESCSMAGVGVLAVRRAEVRSNPVNSNTSAKTSSASTPTAPSLSAASNKAYGESSMRARFQFHLRRRFGSVKSGLPVKAANTGDRGRPSRPPPRQKPTL